MTVSSLKDMTSKGTIPLIRRQFPVAPGETIEKGDVVSVFNNQVYKNSAAPLSALSRFSPDVLYLPSLNYFREIVAISDSLLLTLSTGEQELIVATYEVSAKGIVEKSKKYIYISDVEGFAFYRLTVLSSSQAVIIYKESNSSSTKAVAINFSDSGNLKLGQPTEITDTWVHENSLNIEVISATSFLMVWLPTENVRAKICTLSGTDNLVVTNVSEYNVAYANSSNFLVLKKLDSSRFAIVYTSSGSTGKFLKTKVLQTSGTALNWKAQDTQVGSSVPATFPNDQIKVCVLNSGKYVIIYNTGSGHKFSLIATSGQDSTVSFADWIPFSGATTRHSCDIVRLSDDRFLVALQVFNDTITNAYLFIVTTTGNVFAPVGSAQSIPANIYDPNKLRILPIGNDLYVVTFNYKGTDTFKYSQALMVKANATMTGLDTISTKEQLINLHQNEIVYAFCFASLGTTGRFVAAFANRLKVFTCSWSPVKFITAQTGEFHDIWTGVDVTGKLQKAAVLSNGDVVVIYRERDTRHGKCSVLRPNNGGYNLLYTHTFSYSHVDNLDVLELASRKIVIQFKHRKNPSYDQSQNNHGFLYEENTYLVAELTDTGLTELAKMSATVLPDPYQISFLLPEKSTSTVLRFRIVAQIPNQNTFTRTVDYYLTGGIISATDDRFIDYVPNKFTVSKVGDSHFAIVSLTNYSLFKIRENSSVVKMLDSALPTNIGAETFGLLPWEGNQEYLLAKNSTGCLNLAQYSYAEETIYLTGTVQRRERVIPSKIYSFERMGNRIVLLYKDGNQAPSEGGRPNRDTFIALLAPDRWNRKIKDIFMPLPGAVNMFPVCVPISDNRALVICMDGNGNQIITTAYVDDQCITLGRPNLTPTGVASESGSVGQEIGVVLNGIVDYYTGLTVGATYFTDANGKISATAGSRLVGTAISDKELLISKLM